MGMLIKKPAVIFMGIIAGLIILYFNSFTAGFFQDDFLLLKIARESGWFSPIQFLPYRPISMQVFYSISETLFKDNVAGYHGLLFVIFTGSTFFIYKISNYIFNGKNGAFPTLILYVFNVSLFPLFYWIAVSYFVIGSFFTFGGIYFYLKKGRGNFLISFLFFILGLLSNELIIVFPILLIIIDCLKKKVDLRRVIPFIMTAVLYLPFRLWVAVMPQVADYKVDISYRAVKTFQWYLFRAFNLPEGIRIGGNKIIYILFGLLAGLIVLQTVYLLKEHKFPTRFLFFSLVFFFFGALPFYFLPNHMSAYYLTFAIFGPAVFLSKLFENNKILRSLFIVCYLLMTIFGLNFLSQTHWIILKGQI